jgi:hypothetical protein
MKTTVYEFSPPLIVGALGDKNLGNDFAKTINRELKHRDCFATCLPFQVEAKYLKNMVACMRLMDIIGLVVHPSHQTRIAKYLNGTNNLAKEVGFVDTVVRRGNKFIGINSWAMALRKLAGKDKKRTIVVVGQNRRANAAVKILSTYNICRVKNNPYGVRHNFPPKSLIFDFREKTKPQSYKGLIKGSVFNNLRTRISVDLIVSSNFRRSAQR